MMVPSFPSAHLVVGQPRLTFGALETFLDAMRGFERLGEFCPVLPGLDSADLKQLIAAGLTATERPGPRDQKEDEGF
jgi:hypothetical protein